MAQKLLVIKKDTFVYLCTCWEHLDYHKYILEYIQRISSLLGRSDTISCYIHDLYFILFVQFTVSLFIFCNRTHAYIHIEKTLYNLSWVKIFANTSKSLAIFALLLKYPPKPKPKPKPKQKKEKAHNTFTCKTKQNWKYPHNRCIVVDMYSSRKDVKQKPRKTLRIYTVQVKTSYRTKVREDLLHQIWGYATSNSCTTNCVFQNQRPTNQPSKPESNHSVWIALKASQT